MIAQQFLDDLESRTTMSALVARAPGMKLVKNGREWKACCPVHSEKTPSFTVSDEKGFAHCFGCGFHAGPIRWLTEIEGMDFLDAVRQLAEDAGVAMPERSAAAEAKAAQVAGLRPALEAAQAVFAAQLGRVGSIQHYLQERGVGQALAETFGLGLAPERRGYLADAGIGDTDALGAGLMWRSETGSGPTFAGRIMVPVHDARGRLIGFGGRAAPGAPDSIAKYKNSPQSAMFDKSRVLFNLHRAAPAVRAAKRVLVVEGYFDVIALAGVGIHEAVAPMGTALTEEQLTRLWRLTRAPVLMFDGDAAGRKAARRACERALPGIAPDRTLRIALLPAGKDPDDLAREGGADAVEAVIEQAMPLDAFLFGDLLSRAAASAATSSLDVQQAAPAAGGQSPLPSPAARFADNLDLSHWSPEDRAGFWQELAVLAASIGHDELRGEYLAAWRARYERMVSGVDRAGRGEVLATVTLADDGEHVWPDGEDDSEKRLIGVVQRLLQLRADEREAVAPIREERKFVRELAKMAGLSLPQVDAVVKMIEMDIASDSKAVRHESESILVLYRRVLRIEGPLDQALLPVVVDASRPKAVGHSAPAPARAASALAWFDAGTL